MAGGSKLHFFWVHNLFEGSPWPADRQSRGYLMFPNRENRKFRGGILAPFACSWSAHIDLVSIFSQSVWPEWRFLFRKVLYPITLSLRKTDPKSRYHDSESVIIKITKPSEHEGDSVVVEQEHYKWAWTTLGRTKNELMMTLMIITKSSIKVSWLIIARSLELMPVMGVGDWFSTRFHFSECMNSMIASLQMNSVPLSIHVYP